MRWAAGLLVFTLLSGCGANSAPNSAQTKSSRPVDDEEGKQALRRIPAEDRLAFVEIGVAAGNLRSSAALVRLLNEVRRRDTVTLRRLRDNVRLLRPRDPLLQQLRGTALTELSRAIAARRSLATARASVESTLSGVDEIVRGLRAYVFVHPEVQGLVPE